MKNTFKSIFNILRKLNSPTNKLVLFSILHAFFLLFVTSFLLNINYSFGDETFVYKCAISTKRLLLGIHENIDHNKVVFINTSFDNQLIEADDEEGSGNQVITDRKKLSELFNILNLAPDNYKFILCDIFFKDKSSDDSILASEFYKLKNVIIPFESDKYDNFVYPVFESEIGLIDYPSIDHTFLKYQLIDYDSVKSLPARMYELIHSKEINKVGNLCYIENKLSFNSLIIDFAIRPYNIFNSSAENKYPYFNLGEMLLFSQEEINNAVKNKIIVIGDLRRSDNHRTILGNMPGALILLNIFLNLENENNIVTLPLILVLFFGYFLISIFIFKKQTLLNLKAVESIKKKIYGRVIINGLKFFSLLIILTIIIYAFFGLYVNILLIGIYLNVIYYILNYSKIQNHDRIKRKYW